jgi:excisionase family DNA binding protein
MQTTEVDSAGVDRQPGAPWDLTAAAKFLGLSPRHLVRLADAGKVASIRFGRRRMLADQEVRRVAAEGTN